MLRDIERDAGRAFAEIATPEVANDEPPSVAKLEQFASVGRAWSRAGGLSAMSAASTAMSRGCGRSRSTAAERGWSVRGLESEITRAARPASPRPSPDPDQCAVATRLEVAITRAIGGEATAKPYPKGFQILLYHPAADRLARALGADMGAL